MNKTDILYLCQNIVLEKLRNLKQSMTDLQESANQDTKSSVGDKYETGRAMVQLEQENLMRQHLEFQKINDVLIKINPDVLNDTILIGSLIETNHGHFYLSVGLGKIDIDSTSIFAIAPNSPIGSALLGKKTGDQLNLNGREYKILSVK
jgi:transcription elongation GreA/GreB family factor